MIRPHRLLKEGGIDKLLDEIENATDWLNKNALYLDDNSNNSMRGLFNEILIISKNYANKNKGVEIDVKVDLRKLVKSLSKALSCIKKGVGARYLPQIEETQTQDKSDELWQEVDQLTENLIKEK